MKISSLINNVYRSVSKMMRYFCEAEGAPQNSVLPCRLRGSSRADFVCFILCLALLAAFVPFSGTAQAQTANYTLLINQENADDDTFLVRNELTETRSAAVGTPLTDVLNAAELGSKFSGFHLTGTGAEITGYQPNDDITKEAGTYSEKSSPAFLFAHYESDGSMKADAMGALIEGRVVSGFFSGDEFIPMNAPTVRADGSSVVLAFYSRDRYAISLRAHNDADPAAPVLSTGDAQIPVLPEAPIIIKQGANLYERLVEDEGVGDILKYFSAHEPSHGDELQWTWWARWKGTKENGDPIYEIDPGNQFVGGRSRNKPIDPRHTGTVDLMEGSAYGLKDGDVSVLEMWKRTVKLYGINYTYYEDGQVQDMFDENGMLNPNVKEEVVFGYHNDEAFYKQVHTNYTEGGYTVIPVEAEDINTGETKTSKIVDSKEDDFVIYADKNESGTVDFSITNTYTKPLVNVTVEKVWVDEDDKDKLRPEEITVELLANRVSFTPKKTIVLDEHNFWSGKFSGLDKYDENGVEIKYSVKELNFPFYTEYKVEQIYTNHNTGSIYTITNTHVPENKKVAVTKNWDDDGDRDDIRPTTVYVLLYDNAEKTGIPVGFAQVTETNTGEEQELWTVVFSDLPKYAYDEITGDPSVISYTADELYLPNMTDYKKTVIKDITNPESPYNNHWEITNTYEPEKVTIKVTKDWDDAYDQDGIRPSEVIATLYKGEGSSKTQVRDSNGDPVTVALNAANGWSAEFPEQFAKEAGITIKYSVDEEQFTCRRIDKENCWGTEASAADSGYQKVSVLQTEVNGWTITNKHNPEKITVKGTKEWIGVPEGYELPESITIELKANNKAVDHTVGLKTNSPEYSWSFPNVDKYDGGSEITYTVDEYTVPGFTKSVPTSGTPSSDGKELSFVVTNTYNPEKTQLHVSKIWQDDTNRDGLQPNSVTVKLKSDGGTGAAPDYVEDGSGNDVSVTLNSGNQWSAFFTDLPKYNAYGQEINYSVEEQNFSCPRVGANCLGTNESAADTGYQLVSIKKTDAGGYVITNKHNPETISIPVTKSWDDDDDRDGIRPQNVGVVVRRTNDGAVAGAVTLTETQPSHTFTGLYKYCSGQLCKYTVTEPQVPEGYEMDNAGCTEMTSGSCTLTNSHTPEKVLMKVEKVWDDAENQDGIRPTGNITVTLYKGESSSRAVVRDDNNDPVTVTLNPGNDWEATFPEQFAKENGQTIVYSVEESDFICKRIDDYCLTGNPDTGYQQTGNTGSAESGFTITNKHNPEKITVKGTKEWIGVPEGYELPESITIELKANNKAVDHTVGLKTNSPAYSWSFPDVDKYANGRQITYTVAEYTVPGFTKDVPTSGTWSADGKELSFVVTNTYNPENTQIRVIKIWTDDENRDGLRPDEITVTLYSDGGTGAAPTLVKRMTLSEDNNWSDYFTDLKIHNTEGQVISYTVDEEQFSCNAIQNCLGTDPKAGYVKSGPVKTDVGGYAITNTHTPATIDIPVTKVWDDDNDRDGIRPDSVTFIVRRTNDNKVVDDVTLSGTQTTHTFTGLDKYCGEGELCKYTVTEPQVPQGYTMINNQTDVSCVAMTGGSCTITNKHDPEMITIPVTKEWDDMNNTDDSRPKNVVVEVLADGDSLDPKVTITLSDDSTPAWTGTSSALPKYRDGGTAIVYSLAEYTVENYETSVPAPSDHPEDGYTITNTYAAQTQPLVIRKTWVYNNAPATARLSLREFLAKITVIIDGNKYYFADVQTSGSGYTAVVNGTLVTITATGTDTDNWTVTISGLPKNKWDAGQEKPVAISYSIAEDPIANYYTEYGEPFDAENGFRISNKYNVTEVTVTKSWVDDNNSRGDRPESVLIHLHGSQDRSLREQAISAANAVSGDNNTWSYTFTNLPKYDSNGAEITYYSHEVNVDHYISTVSADKLTITNTWTDTRMININVNKHWDDDDNRDGKRPDSVTFNLLVDGVQQDSMTVTGPAWTGVFGPLPYADESGTPINYSVTEDTVVDKDGKNSYTPKSGDPSGSILNGLVFTNSRNYETVKIRMTKTWDDFSNMYNLRGEQPLKLLQRFRLILGTVQYSLDNLNMTQHGDASTPYLYTASVQGYPVTITASGVTDTSNSWTIEIDGLPKYKNGSVINYDITENPDTYAFTRTKESSTEENTFVFTGNNFLNMQRGVLTKVWEDENNKDSKRPTDPMQMMEGIKLYANGEYYHHGAFTLNSHEEGSKVWTYTIAAHPNVLVTVVDNSDNTWTITVDKLPRILNNQTVVWTVSEEMDGYDSFVDGLNVTNVPQVSVDVTKVWVDEYNQDGIRPATVTVNLFKGSGSSKTQVKDEEGRDVTLTLSEGSSWTGSFTGLPKYETVSGAPDLSAPINYSVEEQTTDVLTGTDGAGTYAIKEEGTMTEGYTITNTHTPELIDITLSKVWDDNNDQDGKRAVASVQLYANGAAVSGKTLTVPVTDSWTENNKFTGLPKYQNGVEINYEIREIPPAGYTPSIAEGNGIEKSFVITNTYSSETVNVPVSKVWNDENDQDGLRAKLTATVMLYANGAEVSGKTLTVGKTDGWSDAFTGLPKYDGGQAITYTVQETITYDSSVTGTPYTITVTGNMTAGFTITNSHTPAVRDVTITKVWDDANNQDGLRRDNVTFNLYQNGNIYRTVTSDSIASPWTYTWTDLPTNCGGSACVYTVDEPTVPRPYTKSIDQTTLTVTNSYTPETVTVQGSKTWVDNDNRAGKRPGTIYIQLWKNGSLYTGSDARKTITANSKELDGTTPWSWKWEGLPKFENGQEIQWSVLEENVSDYQASYPSAYNVTNTYNEGTKSISVKKVWDDDENRDGIRPTYIYVDLYADGVKTTQSKALADANNWLNTFTDLPIYKEGATGVEIVYTVKEANAVSRYTISEPVFDSTTNTFTITNTHTPATTTVQGSKTWVQRELDTNPPSQILIHLYADGTLVDGKDKTITEASEEIDGTPWSWKWEGLPKYKQGEVGKEIVYTVRETPLTGYNTTLNSPNVTNTYSPGKTSLSVRKAWEDGNNQDGIRPGHVEVALLSKVGTADFSPTGQTAILVPDSTTPNLWRVHTFDNLDRFTSTGQPITYSVKEIGTISGYTSSEPILDQNSGVYVITNTHTPDTITITGEKVWDNDDNPTKPTSVTIHLLANGVALSDKTITVTETTAQVDGKAWTWKWEDLPKYANGQEITYTVSEDTLDDYTLTVQRTPAADGKSISFVLTNTYDPGMVTVRVQKVWEDNNNQDGIRPTSVEVKLIADGKTENPVATATLPQEGSWHARFNVPEYDGTRKIVYTVAETFTDVLTESTDGPGTYMQGPIAGDVENGFVITNVHTPETVYIHGNKAWEGDENAPAGTRPESVTFVLKRNNETIAYTVAYAADNWEWEFPLQPRYVNGVDMSNAYEVTELNVPNYETEIDGYIGTNEQDYTNGVTNIYTPGKTSVSVTKVWRDNDNQDGIRPARVAVQLVADGTPVPERYLVLHGTGNSWIGTFNDLDIYPYGSTTPIIYTVQEVGTYAGYTMQKTGDMATGFTITNTHTPEVITVEGTKTWNDNDNVAGKRPESIEITLNKNGVKYEAAGNPVTVSAEESWKWSWTNLPKYENGKEITWSVTETAVENYQTSYSGYDVINTYDEGTTSVNVTKAWNDSNNQDGKRPSFVTVALYADGVATGKTLPLGESNNFTNTFTGLPIYKEGQVGQKIAYTVKEISTLPAGYTTADPTGTAETGFTITNSYTPEKVTVSGSKTWVDSDNTAGARPDSITIRLHKNNEEYASKTVTGADEWKWEWTDLSKYENGTQISWTITEDNVEDYTRQVSGYNVTNTYNPGKTSIRVSKSWKDADNQDGIRPQFIRVHLFANGADTGKEGVLTAPGWFYLFEDLDKNYTYTVVEDVPAGYTAEVNGSATAGFVVTNTHTPETVRIVVTKTWDDAGNEGNRPKTIKLYLHADGTRIDHDEFTSAQTAEPGWKWEITDLPKYKNGGTEIVYTIIEDSYEDYTRSVSRTVTPKTETEPEQLNLAVTNKWTPGKTSIMVEKKWSDNNNQDGIRPDWVLVNLLDGNKNVVASDRVTKANNWILRFNNIDEFDASGKRINYTVEEVYDRTVTESTDGPGTYKFSGVNPIVGGFEIVNTHTPETVSISGTKTWDDNGNQDGKRPASITINLLKNGSTYESKTVTEADGWAYSWTNLPKYENNGSLIRWSLTETPVEGYTRTWNGSSVTNTYDPDSAELTVVKSWNDNNNQDGLRPSYARVYLYADGVKTEQYAILIASNKWTYCFTGLDKFKDGKQIVYTVKEEDADIPNGYTVSYSGDMNSNITVTNTHKPETVKVVVTKTWDDAGNENKRPDTVNLYLHADGEQIRYQQFTSAETAAADWKWEINDLPKYKNGGTEIVYTIRENTYPDYSRTVSHSVTPKTDTEPEIQTLAVTNKWTPGTTSIAVQKIWTDGNNQDGIRPDWVLVNLKDGNGNVVASDRVMAPNWILRFENIAQYDASGNPIQYSVEEVYDRTITEATDGPGTYKFDGVTDIEGVFAIKNVHTPETVTVSGAKTWDDNGNQDGKRPTSITIRLMKNNVEHDHKVVTAADDWKWEWTKLPKYENGKQITWSITEDDVTDYTKVVSGYNVTNTYNPGKINIRVNKVWHDENNQDGLRQLNVTVFLKANGETVATGVLNEASGWSYVFKNQDRNKDGKAITYTVEELHTAFITGVDGPGTYQDVPTGDVSTGFTITNTHTPETVTLKGTKTWVGTELDPNAPTELKVHLYANGTEVTAQAKTVTAADGWKWEWTNLPKYANGREITYTMSEDTDYTKRVVREGDTFNVTNTYNPDEITILIRKVWNDNNNQDGIRPPWTLVNLKGNGETVASEFLNDGNEWRVSIDVPQYDENQQEIKYTVEEVFTRTVTEDTDGPGTYKLESIDGNAKDGFTIINKHTPETVDVAGSKTWNDNDNAAGMRPSAIKIQLNKNGVAYGAPLSVTEADGWKWEWKKVPKYENGQLISWSINEENVEGYSKTVTGYNVTNTYTPDETVVTVRKAWNDKDNQDGLRTDHSRVYLLADGERTGDEGILIAANEWVYHFRRLPVMKDGKKIVYTVEEDPVPAGYTASYSGDQDKGLVVTNTHNPETVKIVVTKTWDDAGNEANRPETVNLYLQADGATIRNGQFTSDETAAVGWKWEIDNLPKFKNGGTAIAYTIVENDSGEYSRSVERSVTPKTDTEKEQLKLHVTNKWTPGTTSIVVEKEWTDNGNQDGIRPPWILVNLLDGDGNVVQSGRLTAENNWLLRFDGVEEFDESGQKIAYSVEEVYDNVITKETDGPGTYRLIRVREIAGGFEIENGHTPETVTVSGAKTWNDEGNESARPESITIRVLGDGAEVAHKEVTASDDWKWEFSGLPKYKAGKLITYTITEDAIPNYTPQINGFNVTNTYEEGVTSVSVKKVWSDGNNQDGLRDWVVIKLLANGEETEHMTVLSDSNHWEHTFTRLPAMAGGEAIVYTVDEEKNSRITGEDGPGTYKIDIQGDQTSGFIVNNIHTPETVTISGHKTWDDNENENQARPQSIFIKLNGDGQLLHRVAVTEADDWAWNFVDLPKYANGKEIKYSIQEEAVEHYTPSYSGYDVTNTYTQGKTSVSVSKIWDDGENRDNLRPTWILVKLLENGEESGMMAVLNERNSWKHTFTNLDVSKDGQPVSYSVAEELGGVLSDTDTAETYGYIINGNAAEGYVITNKHTPVTTSVSVTKFWDDGNDRDGKRPAEVLIRLYANRVQIDQDYIRPDEEGKWTLSFTNLPKNENGKPISYTVEEMPIEDYSTIISGDASTGYTITNSYTPGETSLTVTKRWEDDSNRDGKRPASAVIHLLADGDEVNSITLAANNNWQHTFTGLPVNKDGVKIVYTVTEDAVEGYSEPVVKGDAENGFTVINAYHPQTINIPVTKVWDDGEDQDGKRPESVTVRLLADGAEVEHKELNEGNGWEEVFTGKPVYQSGKKIAYTLTEDRVDDYTTSIIGTASVGFTVTNSYEPGKTSLSVAKRWEDADNQDGIRPEDVTVTLLANGEPTDQVVKLNVENNWRHEFESLDEYADGVKIEYSVSEDAVTGYTTTIEGEAATGYTIVNAHSPENIAVRGVKVWNDNDNAAGVRPESIIVRLHANEVEIDSQSVHADAEGNWEWAFRGLPKYADEREIRYTITEDAPEQYSAEITGNAKDGFTITNTYAENKTSMFVSKHWTDFYNNDGKRPASVEVKVLADYGDGNGYVETEYSGVITGPDWELIINDLPLTVDGVRVKYKVAEETIPGYKAVVEGDPVTGYMITNVHELETVTVSGQKTWNDNNNSAQARPEAIVVRLNSDGTLLHEIRVTAEDDWKWSFSGLPKYQGGREIVYTIHENPVDNYTPSVDGYNITNNYTSGKRSLPIDAAWLDQNNRDGLRPGSVTIKLFADGEDTGKTLVLDESNGWRDRFTDLPICSANPKWLVSKAPSYEDICAAEGKKHVVYTIQEVHTDVITGENTETTYADEYVGSSQEGWTVINRHTPVKINVEGTKTWSGGSADSRPESITVRLFNGNNEIDHRTVTEAEGWSWSFTDLWKYENGEEIRYVISEDAVTDYTAKVDGYNITNTYSPSHTDVTVRKEWDDSNNAEGLRPEYVMVNLLSNGTVFANAELRDSNGWTHTFQNLPIADASGPITYDVAEVTVPGYTVRKSGDSTQGFTIYNVRIQETIDIPVRKVWSGVGEKPASLTIALVVNGVRSDQTIVLTAAEGWSGSFNGLAAGNTYSVEELDVPEGYTCTVSGSAQTGFTVTNKIKTPPTPPEPPHFFRLTGELPETGITTVGGYPLSSKPASVNYLPTTMELQLPTLDIMSSIVTIEPIDGRYPVEWLGYEAGLLDGTAKPGEGISVIAAHNTLNSEDYGPFALIMNMEEGDRFFVTDDDGSILIFQVYANEKIGSHDYDGLWKVASEYDNTLTLLTCEDERAEGGYASRRAVAARRVN